jgi:hypothetical protein
MRPIPLLLVIAVAVSAPAAGQGIVVPVRCHGECPPPDRLPRSLVSDSVQVSAHVDGRGATTYVDQWFRNGTAGVIDGAFFFPLPRGATLTRVSVYEGTELEVYNQWNGPEESRWILEGITRGRADSGLREHAGVEVVHVAIPSVPAHGTQRVQIAYTQPPLADGGALGYRYPLSVWADAAPVQHLKMVVEVKTAAGFRGLSSPSHAVRVRWGEEMGRCPPRSRCGSTNVPSRRVKVVTFRAGPEARARDFELVYTITQPSRAAVPER